MPNTKNIKIFINYWLGPIIFTWLGWSIFRQVRKQSDLQQAWLQIQHAMGGEKAWQFFLAILLMLFNWGVEALKWRELLRPIYNISFFNSFKATLAGVTFAVNTPNRIGEYGGRILYVPEGKRVQAVSLTLVGSYSQLLVTLITGTTGLWIYYCGMPGINLPPNWQSYLLWIRLLCLILSAVTLFLLLFYLRISWLARLFEKLPGIEKWGRPLFVIDHIPVTILLRVLGWSFSRYIVFLFQYILLLNCFGSEIPAAIAGWMVTILFLILAIVPTIALAEIGIRGKLALELFGLVSSNQLGIFTATASIWLINLVLPAIAGSLLIMRIKIFETVNRKAESIEELHK